MNQVIQGTVRELERKYKAKPDNEIITEIRMGHHAGEALFYLLFGRYAEMLHVIFSQQSSGLVEFDDFMLELDIKLFAGRCAVIDSFDERRASFKTYLSMIAHNLLYDMRAKEMPMLDIETVYDSVYGVETFDMFVLIDAINTYPNPDSRYVLLKTIEGYKSKEIAVMLTSRRHEEGTLEEDKELKPSYIDTLRSRALKAIRHRISGHDKECASAPMATPSVPFEDVCASFHMEEPKPRRIPMAVPNSRISSLFIMNICELYNQMMKE